MKPISLHYFTGLMEKVIYVFHGNGNPCKMMIFITIIQPKIHEHCFYFKLFFTSKQFLSGHNSQKQSHIFFNINNMFKNSFTNCLFRSSRTFFLISFRSSGTFLKNHETFSGAATNKKICSEAAAQNFTVTAHTLCEDFHGLSMFMKNIIDGWLKNFVQKSNAVILLNLHRFVESLFNPKFLAPILRIFGNFSIFLLAAKLWSGAFGPVLETLSGILSLPE